MNDLTISFFAWITTFLHVFAYLIYVRFAILDEVQPNPTSWLMWTYGTALVVLLEWEQEASFSILFLPVVCAACSLIVAFICWRKGRLSWPKAWSDRAAFVMDLTITALYIFLLVLEFKGAIGSGGNVAFKTTLLVLVNVSTFVSFWPILRSTYTDPAQEHWLAWFLWTTAYALLGLLTLSAEGFSMYTLQFLLYPFSCMLLSGLVCWYALGSGGEVAIQYQR